MSPAHWHLRPFAARCLLAPLLFTAALGYGLPGAAAGSVTARTGQIELPTYPWSAVQHPYFRGTDKVNIYPYPMLDFLSREKTNRFYRTVVLENEYLRVTFLPELGGKIYEVIDKATGRPMFYVNHVVKPGLIGQCGGWTSGGVEWNTGPQGHTVSCLQPVDVVILPAEADGSRAVAVGETERIYGTKWTVIVTLRPGRSFLEERIRIYNPTETVRPYYFWNCTAAPNTPGFRFVYPMTLGCDHAGEKFFHWPIDHGKDLTRGTNYLDASSIFAWHCDQDFFGSYNDDLACGVVAYANHHQLPGKKAWTWGQGGFGQMHQRDLTDDDGPYNEVQTGPLLTQAQVGRLDPCQAVEWQEWWYPVHGIGGFTFANQDVAVNAGVEGRQLRLRMLGTLARGSVRVTVRRGNENVASAACALSPRKPADLRLELGTTNLPVQVNLEAGSQALAQFSFPLALPEREPPSRKQPPRTETELVRAGWQDYLFARFSEAEARFHQALKAEPDSSEARTGLAYLNLDRDPRASMEQAEAALAVDPDHGFARFALAAAEYRAVGYRGFEAGEILENAWQAARASATAVAGRALVAKMLIRQRDYDGAVEALSAAGPWQGDPVCRNRLAFALLQRGDKPQAIELARANLVVDPLDAFARSVLWLAKAEAPALRLAELVGGRSVAILDLVSEYSGLGQADVAVRLCEEHYFAVVPSSAWDPLVCAWATWLSTDPRASTSKPGRLVTYLTVVNTNHPEMTLPDRWESLEPLSRLCATETVRQLQPRLKLYLGHLLFHLGRYAQGRKEWQEAAQLGAEPVIAYRALGMAARTLDGDLPGARQWLERASQADPKDPIVARDLANILFDLAEKAGADDQQRELRVEARDRLKAAFAAGKGRSDFVALLARAQNRLGDFAETARMLDQVRVTVWEGAHEVHDLFEQAHLALGEAHLKAGRPAEALAEFNRALEYPANLATGKLENAREAHIHYQRGNALAALGRKQEALAAWRLAASEPESKDARLEQARQKAKEALAKSP